VRLEQGIALLDDAVFVGERRLGCVQVADRVLEVALEFCDGLGKLA
jgi:hypothetical protein